MSASVKKPNSIVIRISAGNYRVKADEKYYVILNWKYGWEIWSLDTDSDLCLSVLDWQKAYPAADHLKTFRTLRAAATYISQR